MDDNLIVTVNLEDVSTAFADGSIIRMTGTDEDGRRVTFAGDHRPMSDLIEGVLADEDESAMVELEPWQILSIEKARLTTEESLDLMMHLDNGTNMFGSLTLDARARIFALVDNPDQETWDNAHGIIVSGTDPNKIPTTLWGALNRHTDYQVIGRSVDQPWREIPTREQILTALKEVLS